MNAVVRFVISGAVVALVAGQGWAQALPENPRLTTGQLDNGLSYIVREHANPPDRAAVWLHMHTGSLNETDPQRGLAHYLEHMAFNGSENFPPGAVVPFFESLGMTFGRDQNAFTSFDQTVYQLSLPDTKPETLGKGMTFFADVLSELLLTPGEIEAERQIIQEERRRSLSGRQRTSFYVLERLAPGSILGDRITIGTEETIAGVQRPDFKDYYGKWYRPSNATLIVVADLEPAKVVKSIEQYFGDAVTVPRPAPQKVGIKPYEKSLAIVASDPEVRSEEIEILRIDKPLPPITTVPQYRANQVAHIAQIAFNDRLQDKVAAGGTSYHSAESSLSNMGQILRMASISGKAAPGKWREAFKELALELQRARAFGFSKREIEDAKRQILASAKRAVETQATRPASSLINSISRSVNSGNTILSVEQRLELTERFLPEISAEEVAERFGAEFDTSAVAFIATLPESADVPTEAQLLEIGVNSLAVTPEREEMVEGATELMAELPKPGEIQERGLHAASGVESAWLSNNVRVHHRYMDIEKNQVTVSISLLGGELLETSETRGVTRAAMVAWSRPSTRKLSSSEIRDLMVGKNISVGGAGGRGHGGSSSTDSITLTVSGSPKDLESGMQLAHLLLSEPKIESAAFAQFKTRTRQMIEMADTNPMMKGMRLLSGSPYPADVARTQPITVEQLDRLTEEAAQAWLDKLINESPIEVAVVGDVSKDRAMELVTRYLGSLSSRDEVHPKLFADRRALALPTEPRTVAEAIATTTPQAFVMSAFYGPDETNLVDLRPMNVATRILSTRMIQEIREEAQLVYSISAMLRSGKTYPGFGMVMAAAPTEPAKADALTKKIASMYQAMAQDGVTGDEIEVAKKQFANIMEEQMRSRSFWLAQMSRMTFRGLSLDNIVSAPAAYEAVTAEQVQATFSKYYRGDPALVVTVIPK